MGLPGPGQGKDTVMTLQKVSVVVGCNYVITKY